MNDERTYEDYEELGRYLKTAEEAVDQAQMKIFDMFGGLDPLVEPGETVTPETRPRPNLYDKRVLDIMVRIHHLQNLLAENRRVEFPSDPMGDA
jgi:hypothetical protein